MTKVLAILTALVGVALAVTPWLLRFTTDRLAFADVLVVGLAVAVLGLLSYEAIIATRPRRIPR